MTAFRGAALLLLFFLTGCIPRRSTGEFRVLPAAPEYLLESPESRRTPFPEVLRAYNGFAPAQGWIDLRPLMELRVENAYYQPGASRRGLEGYLGTEIARYRIEPEGLLLAEVQSMKDRPAKDLPVQDLVSPGKTAFRHYRLYYEIVFARKNNEHGSVLLGADTEPELEQLSTQLADPESVCTAESTRCTVFPDACSVSVEMVIRVNGQAQRVVWRSLLSGVVTNPRHLTLKRLYAGRLTPVRLNLHDPQALQLPLLPGDQINWN